MIAIGLSRATTPDSTHDIILDERRALRADLNTFKVSEHRRQSFYSITRQSLIAFSWCLFHKNHVGQNRV